MINPKSNQGGPRMSNHSMEPSLEILSAIFIKKKKLGERIRAVASTLFWAARVGARDTIRFATSSSPESWLLSRRSSTSDEMPRVPVDCHAHACFVPARCVVVRRRPQLCSLHASASGCWLPCSLLLRSSPSRSLTPPTKNSCRNTRCAGSTFASRQGSARPSVTGRLRFLPDVGTGF